MSRRPRKKGKPKTNKVKPQTPSYDFSKIKKETLPLSEEEVRLNKYIANAGICSRREADKLIEEGRIAVNGKVTTEMGLKVTREDEVTFDGKALRKERLVYILLNKPKDYITTTKDPQERQTVMELVKNACDERIYPVGRLDRKTTGLLLLTNDGSLAEKLLHPSKNITKIYQVELNKALDELDFERILNTIELEDGPVPVKDLAYVTEDKEVLGIEVHIGKNRIIRRLFEYLGYEVKKLDRVAFAGLTKKDLPRGRWRFLKEKEVIKLKHLS